MEYQHLLDKVKSLINENIELKLNNSTLMAELKIALHKLSDVYGKQLELGDEHIRFIALKWYVLYCSKNKQVPDADMISIIDNCDHKEASELADRFNDVI